MGTIYLERMGKSPMQFDGFLLAEVVSSEFEPVPSGRFHTIRVYSTLDGKIVAEISFATLWMNEPSYSSSEILDSLGEVDEYLQAMKLPPKSTLEDSDRLDIETRYSRAVTKVLKHLELTWEL